MVGPIGSRGALLNPMSMTDAELLDSVPMEKSNGDQMNADMKMKPVGGEENHTDAVKSDAAEKLTSEIKGLKVTISKLEADNSDLREETDLNKDEFADLRDLFGHMEKDAEEHEKEIKRLKEENVKLKEGSSSLETNKTKLTEENKALNVKNDKSREEISKLQVSLTESEKKSNLQDQKIKESQTKISLLETQIKQQKEDTSSADEIKTLKEKLSTSESQVADLQNKLKDKSDSEKSNTHVLANKAKELEELKGKKTEMTLAEFWDVCKKYFIYNMFVMYIERNKIIRTQKLSQSHFSFLSFQFF